MTKATAARRGPPSALGKVAGRPHKMTRAEKSEHTRRAICDAAAQIVGEYGYAEASISRIMERAGFGHGTFYAYFGSRDELFDELLPMKGVEVQQFLHARVKGSSTFIEMETRGFRGFLHYARENPWFFRLLHEAPVAAPRAYRKHIETILQPFRRALTRSWERGEFPHYSRSELDTLAYLLISARDYVFSQHVARSRDVEGAMDEAVETYRKFISHGLGVEASYAPHDPQAKPDEK